MPVCTSCGQENPEIARFCLACAAPLEGAPRPQEVRKTVTIVFSDLSGSTAMGDRLDPESVRRIMSRYFDEMRGVLERHGGTVEKFIGDAVMAVFGIPEVREDDALRAVRAAAEMREAQARLNEELHRTWGVQLAVRTGVNTGEVIAGDPSQGQAFATGDAVNVAARFEQAAPPGEILIGKETFRLVRDAVEVEPVEALAVKGKPEPLTAWRLVSVDPRAAGATRQLDSPLVGRDQELGSLMTLFERAVGESSCHIATVLGPPGAGKSRLIAELAGELGAVATVLEGRCLPYGEGITFWPVAEMVRGAAGITDRDAPEQARRKVEDLLPPGEDAPLVSRGVETALGIAETASTLQEVFWAVRRLLEALAQNRPVIAIFDDIHWAEEGLLDLIEYVAGWSRGAPILLVCLARQELLELRPSLATPKPNSTSVLLESLAADEAGLLIENLLGGSDLASAVRRRLVEAAEGNPLFLEELLQMLIDEGALRRDDGRWLAAGDLTSLAIPPTINALLAARLDRLDHGERGVVQRASVVGKTFWWGAVTALSPAQEQGPAAGHLQTLVRKQLIEPDASIFSGDDAFRFSHILIRDAAYLAVPKEARAELHERFADWLEAKAGSRLNEYEEILAYHLEEAHGYRTGLGRADVDAGELAARAAVHLLAAGRRAIARGDVRAASNLLGRATNLMPSDDPDRIDASLAYAEATRASGELSRAGEILDEAHEAARAIGDDRRAAHVAIQNLLLRTDTDPELGMDEVIELSKLCFPTFEQAGDDLGFAKAWRAIAEVHLTNCRWGSTVQALERALAHADAAGDRAEAVATRSLLVNALLWGPTPAEEGIRRCRAILEEGIDQRMAEASTLCCLAGFQAMRGEFATARDLYRRGAEIFEELGHSFGLAAHTLISGTVELLAGDVEAAEGEFRRGYDLLGEMGETAVLSSSAALLAAAVCERGRLDEAEELTRVSEENASPDDAASHIAWRTARARVLAERGDLGAAERLAREAVARAEATDFLNMQGDALRGLAFVMRRVGNDEEERRLLARAQRLYEQKGNVVLMASAEQGAGGTQEPPRRDFPRATEGRR